MRPCWLGHAVVFGMEDACTAVRRDVLVTTAIAGHEVGVEHFVVVGE